MSSSTEPTGKLCQYGKDVLRLAAFEVVQGVLWSYQMRWIRLGRLGRLSDVGMIVFVLLPINLWAGLESIPWVGLLRRCNSARYWSSRHFLHFFSIFFADFMYDSTLPFERLPVCKLLEVIRHKLRSIVRHDRVWYTKSGQMVLDFHNHRLAGCCWQVINLPKIRMVVSCDQVIFFHLVRTSQYQLSAMVSPGPRGWSGFPYTATIETLGRLHMFEPIIWLHCSYQANTHILSHISGNFQFQNDQYEWPSWS